jgi:hypothetical protein
MAPGDRGVIGLSAAAPATQTAIAPVNDLPNPYQTVRHWGTLPDGRIWGSTVFLHGIHVDGDGNVLLAARGITKHVLRSPIFR